MSSTRTSRFSSFFAFIASGLFIVAAIWLLVNRQYALDQVSVWSYEPASSVESISQEIELTDKGKFIFYATRPSLERQASFNEECPRQEVGSPILGCYTGKDRIYIYDITNDQLKGMEEVTAAHELLHAVWYRTSEADRKELAAQLNEAYERVDNDDIKSRMEYYKRTEPTELTNELHAILGTEVESLGEPLESYYAQFFNRSAVLELHVQYRSVYDGLYSRADELYTAMESLGVSIQSRSAAYEANVRQYVQDVDSFNTRANNGSFSSQSQFNNERAALIARSGSLDAEREVINTSINTYNKYHSEYQAIAKQIEVLNDSLDSFNQLEQAPSV